MNDRTQIADAVKAILNQTESEIVSWTMDTEEKPAQVTCGRNWLVDVVYHTNLNGQALRLYERSTPLYSGDEFFGYEEDVILEMATDDGQLQWTFPYTPDTKFLLKSVQWQTSHADIFIQQILTMNAA